VFRLCEETPNARPQRERPRRDPSAYAEPPPGRDALQGRVRRFPLLTFQLLLGLPLGKKMTAVPSCGCAQVGNRELCTATTRQPSSVFVKIQVYRKNSVVSGPSLGFFVTAECPQAMPVMPKMRN
jgi:hypothetical protein